MTTTFPLCVVALLFASACASSQTKRGETFCRSYQDNYLGTCQQYCEGELPDGDMPGSEKCRETCRADLDKDDTYRDSCGR